MLARLSVRNDPERYKFMGAMSMPMDDRRRSSLKWGIVCACGWTIYGWVAAGKHQFSPGWKEFAIVSTAVWFILAAIAALRLWQGRNDP